MALNGYRIFRPDLGVKIARTLIHCVIFSVANWG